MLGINHHSEEFLNFKQMYLDCIRNNPVSEDTNDTMHQIKVDVMRTFKPYKLKFLNADVHSGKNKLYNLLKVYALLIEPEIGYTQGMNFIAALILMHVPDEVLACRIFIEVLNKNEWVRMYIVSTPKLFDVAQLVYEEIRQKLPDLYQHLQDQQVILEVVLAGPLLTLFGSILPFSEATHILNLFILDGEQAIFDLVMKVMSSMKQQILQIQDSFEIQSYLARDLWDHSL